MDQTSTLQKCLSKTTFVIPAKAGMAGIHKRFSPENSSNRFIILAPQGFGGDCLRFYATLGQSLPKNGYN
jgi:hypothetical protein